MLIREEKRREEKRKSESVRGREEGWYWITEITEMSHLQKR